MISKSEISNALADCIKRMEAGSTLDQVLADYPHLAGQLRELLITAQNARPSGKAARVPASAQIDSRRRMLAQAKELKRRDQSNLFFPLFRFLWHNSGTILVGLTTFALLIIALGSTRALPGDSLYPVKIVAEQAGSSIYVGSSSPLQREDNFDNRRITEINQMIFEKRTGSVQFAGFLDYSKAAGWQVAGISLAIPSSAEKQTQALTSAYVDITGILNSRGVVEVNMVRPRLETIRGTLTAIQGSLWQVGSSNVLVSDITNISGNPHVGNPVIIQATRLLASSQVLAMSIKLDRPKNLATTEPIEKTAPPPAATRNSAPIPTRPVIINTPQPQDDTQPQNPQPTSNHHNEDDSNKKGGNENQKDD
jgi:hypothetical protein